jgi:ATP-dependent helicase Lhr and Lhr-like helicase
MPESSLLLFHPLIQQWFREQVGKPTDVQEKAWPEISQGKHVLVTAPTGCGKTLASFLWALNQLINGTWPGGTVRVLYISPLKALNNDVQRNLLKPLEELRDTFDRAGTPFPSINVFTRSGDTPGEERRKMVRRPPEILITTPESLNLLLTSRSGRSMLLGIQTVILDEIHAVVGTKRGTHLITAVDRLVPLCGDFQRIALSATVNPVERVAAFVGGFRKTGHGKDSIFEKRPVTLVQSKQAKTYDITVSFPPDAREKMVDGSWWPALIDAFRETISKQRSTLLFANSRRTTEKVTRMINEASTIPRPLPLDPSHEGRGDTAVNEVSSTLPQPLPSREGLHPLPSVGEGGGEGDLVSKETKALAYAHHGSLSRELRLAVEQKLKNGELKAIVATNSLELGIDVGSLDQVVLIQTPRSVSSALQRIGRSGHSVGEQSRGLLFPTHGRDFIDAAVMARASLDQDIEEVHPVEAPLDLLAQIILSMVAMEKWDIDELYAFLKTSYPYRALPRKLFDMLLEMLAGRYADSRLRELKARVSLDRVDNTIQAHSGVPYLLYTSGGTIPERGYFDMRLTGTHAKIGELDEEFVWERSIGESFTLGTQLWRIEKITHNDVEVVPVRSAVGIFPFWKAEAQDRDYHFSEKIGLFLEHADTRLDAPDFRQELLDRYVMEEAAAEELLGFLKLQKEATGSSLPHRHHLLIEHVEEPGGRGDFKQVILHTFWGGRVNRPFALALAEAWEEKERKPLQFIANDDAILLMLPWEFRAHDLFSLLTSENVEAFLRKKLEQTGFFGARFRENAERALLLPKASFKRRMPLWLIRLRSKELLAAVSSYGDFPIVLETWRTCLEDEFDLPHVRSVIEELRTGMVRVSETVTRTASPFAGSLVWKQTNKYMYEDDTPIFAKESAVRPDLIKELLFSSHLRPKIPAEVIRVLDNKLKRTAPGYAPATALELLDWVKERLLIPQPEWKELAGAIRRDHDEDGAAWLASQTKKLFWVSWPGVRHPLLCSLETIPKVVVAFRLHTDVLTMQPTGTDERTETIKRRVLSFLREPPESAKASEEYDLAGFLSEWLSYYGPLEKEELVNLLGITLERIDEAIEPLIESQDLVMDRFREESRDLEICDSGNLEVLLRMARRYRQPSFEPLTPDQLPLFLAAYQGIVPQGGSLDDLKQRLEQLFGLPAPVGAWEEYILPSRMQQYRSEWLDRLMNESDLIWFGCGQKRISLAFNQDLELFHTPHGREQEVELDHLIPDRRGRYSFLEMTESSHMDTGHAMELLWKEAWKGNVTSDSFRDIRKGVLTGFSAQTFTNNERLTSRRSGFNRWKVSRPLEGHWLRIDPLPQEQDLLETEELVKDRVRQLLKRFGILSRPLLVNELPPFQWRAVFRSLRMMELSGELLSGYFFDGLPGPQFVSPEALRMLREPLPHDAIFWINAVDPASPCGLGLAALAGLPSRIASTHLVYHGSRLVMTTKRLGKNIELLVPPNDKHLAEYFVLFKDLLGREFNPVKKIVIETINDEPAMQSPYQEPLRQFGFRSSRNALELWREL